MNIELTISDERVNDLLTGHAGRMSDWIKEINVDHSTGAKVYVVTFDREEDAEGTFGGKERFGKGKIAKGLALMASTVEGSHEWAKFLTENDDDVSFDTAWQFIVFGKLIYG